MASRKKQQQRYNYRRLNSYQKWLVIFLGLLINTCFEILPAIAQGAFQETKIERVFVRKVIVEGSTVFTAKELEELTKPFWNKYATPEELLLIRTAVTNLYVQKGYITSGAIVPPQNLRSGVVRIKVIEGRLERIEVKGLTRTSEDYVRSRLARFASTPLNINDLEDGLKLLLINPIFDKVSASLEQGTTTSQSILVVTLSEAKSFSLGFTVDNSLPSAIGSTRWGVDAHIINVLGLGDRLDISYGLSVGLNEFNVSYDIPINAKDGTLSIAYQNQQNRIVEKPFESLGISAKYNELSFSYRQPIINTVNEELALSLSLNIKNQKTFIFDDQPFSFSPEAQNGETRVTNLNFKQEWFNRSPERVFAFRSNFSFGLDIFDVTTSNYFIWLGQFQWLEKINDNIVLVTQLSAQFTPDKLLPQEQFAIGGVYTVRGYPRDLRIGDNGIQGSIEARFTLVNSEDFGKIELTPFFDVGTVWNNQGNIPTSATLASLGLQLGWIWGDFQGNISYGFQLIPSNANSFDDNFNFSVRWIPIRF